MIQRWTTAAGGCGELRWGSPRRLPFPTQWSTYNRDWGINSPSYAAKSGACPLSIKSTESGEVRIVPLLPNEPPRFSADDSQSKDWKGIDEDGRCILTETSMLIPFDTLSERRGFWEIPYADIQKWLAANSPEANKPAPTADKPGPNAPTPPAPKTK